jgi:inhibitor of cysteine peptidase
MGRCAIILLALAFFLIGAASANSICDNAPCEKVVNASLGKEFIVSVESNPRSTGFDWWTSFDPQYVNLVNATYIPGNKSTVMVGVPGREVFTFVPKSTGDTELTMLYLQPWENGTIGGRKIYPISIVK